MMNGNRLHRGAIVVLASLGLFLPQPLLAAPPNQSASSAADIFDVRLSPGNVLSGQVVTPQNVPMADTEVVLFSGGKKLTANRTDKNGRFAFSRMPRGVYQFVAAEGHGAYRVWESRTAPPSAQQGVLIVAGSETVRGQNGMRTFRNLMANPLVIAGVIATAIAVPIAVSNNRKPASP